MNPVFINNQNITLFSELKNTLQPGSRVHICVNYFTFNAIFSLLPFLEKTASVQILLQDHYPGQMKRKFVNDISENETHWKLESYYRFKKVLHFLREDHIRIRNGNTGGNNFITIDQHVYQLTPHNLNEPTLGIVKDGSIYQMIGYQDPNQNHINLFSQLWSEAKDCEKTILDLFQLNADIKTPHEVYKYTLSKIFEKSTDENKDAERMSRSGFKDSQIWKMLYNFQKDAVLGAIDKIEKYNGCIIADSVGLGKTFEALAVIKYYELRNDRVLVLTPKKLRDNWLTYTQNYTTNILGKDRFNYDVLNHTDLSRDRGLSGDINLAKINWGNYDLIVIDESHNFRNNHPGKDRMTRYEKLMEDIIKAGVPTKVLMLSATPVNTKLNDIKNQLAFITENNDQALASYGIGSIDNTLRMAQSKFNRWMKQPDLSREDLIAQLNGDYFKLLDIFTISRSRNHIRKYYDVSDIGSFPERLKPISIYSDFDSENKTFSISQINELLEGLNLKLYSPIYFVHAHKQKEYAEKYDTKTKSGAIFTQRNREEGIIHLMRVNLLKRLESSIFAFRLTLEKLLNRIENLLNVIDDFDQVDSELDIHDFDFDDEAAADLYIGDKVKVLLQDMDRHLYREYLEDDRSLLKELLQKCEPIHISRDKKLKDLIRLIEDKIRNPINGSNKKVIVFSAFADTARYLYQYCSGYFKEHHGLYSAIISGGDRNKTNMPGTSSNFEELLIHFSPHSKYRKQIYPDKESEIDLLFCTDCISEGQNLQDCDFLINYDIHWNPVRIIQRFGRIDRIGSINSKIQLVNFFPNIELDQYIDLVERVKGRMQIVDISATGDDNLIDEREGEKQELEYRKQQLKRMQEVVVDLEDMEGGISISDLTFNDFKVERDQITKEEKIKFDQFSGAVFSLVSDQLKDLPPGVLFCLKDLSNRDQEKKLTSNMLHPYILVYISQEGEVIVPSGLGKKGLDTFRKLSGDNHSIMEPLIKNFNIKTKSGKHMNVYQDLLDVAQQHISGKIKEKEIYSLFDPEGSLVGGKKEESSYELVSYIINSE